MTITNLTKQYETRSRHPEQMGVWLPLTLDELRDSMQRNGMRYSELVALIEDLDAGHTLTADNGRQYRALTPMQIERVDAEQWNSDDTIGEPDETLSFELRVVIEGAAFDDDRCGELARMLRLAADRVEIGVTQGKLRDSNGITLGSHELKGV